MSSPSAAPARRRRRGNVTELAPPSKPKAGPKAAASKDLRTPPAWLSAPAKALWRQVVPKLDEAYPETLSALDLPALGLMLEHHAIAIAAAQAMRGKGNKPDVLEKDEAHRDRVRKTPASQVMRDHGKAYVELARDYGMTLRGRVGIDLEKLGGVLPDDGDDGDDLFDD